MDKIKCSFFGCQNIMDVKNNEVKAINIRNDGHRFVCLSHYNFVKENNIKPSLELIYGPKKERKHENKNFFRNQKRPNWKAQTPKD